MNSGVRVRESSIFSLYLEHGFGIIPLFAGKNPGFDAWNKFCERLLTPEEAAAWDNFRGDFNIGLPCGPANNIIAVDIDNEDPKIAELVPPSFVRKRGAKGETRFFQYSKEIPAEKIYAIRNGMRDRAPSVEVLSLGNQTVLPPSIHPDTHQPYVWLTEAQLPTTAAAELPILTLKDLEPVKAYLQGSATEKEIKSFGLNQVYYNDDPTYIAPHGSQDRVKALISSLIHARTPVSEALEMVIQKEAEIHRDAEGNPAPYLAHGKKGDQRADQFTNTLVMYGNVMRSINRSRTEDPVVPPVFEMKKIDISKLSAKPSVKLTAYPNARGIMGSIQKLVQTYSDIENSALGLGAAVSAMATLCSNRLESYLKPYVITPNVYALILVPTGGGKEAPQLALKDIFGSLSKEERLLGRGGYVSKQGLLLGLAEQQNRLDIIDEISSLFRTVKKGKSPHETSIQEALCKLWSSANSEYLFDSAKIDKDGPSSVYRPHVNMFGATTPIMFENTVSSAMASSGLMPRFLYFIPDQMVLASEIPEITLDSVLKEIRSFLDENRFNWDDSLGETIKGRGKKFIPKRIPFSSEAALFLKDMRLAEVKSIGSRDATFEDDFSIRRRHQVMKAATWDAASLGRGSIELDSVEWGIQLFDAQWARAKRFAEVVSFSDDNPVHQLAMKMLMIVKDWEKSQGLPIKGRDFTRKVGACAKGQKADAIEFLESSGKLFKATETGKTKSSTLYSTSPFPD